MDKDLSNGHAALRDAVAAEVKAKLADRKALARGVRAQAQGAWGPAPVRRASRRGTTAPPTALAGGI